MFFLICIYIFRSSKYCFCSPCLLDAKCWFCISLPWCCCLAAENLQNTIKVFGKGMVSITLIDLKCLYLIIIGNNLHEGFYSII